MTEDEPRRLCRYRPPERAESPDAVCLMMAGKAGAAERYPFVDRLEIGRDGEFMDDRPGRLLIADPTVSHRHCILMRQPDGRCFVRDVSRNGTRLDGHRLVPNVEVERRLIIP